MRSRRTFSVLHCILLAGFGLCTVFPVDAGTRTIAQDNFELPIRGIVRASRQAELSTDIAAPAVRVVFQEGENFSKGNTLVEFDCRVEKSRLASAVATRQEMQVKLESANYLKRMNAGSQQEVAVAQAQLQRAEADIAELMAIIDRCAIIAPYDGAVFDLKIRQYETPKPGSAILSIVDLTNPGIEMIVPSNWLARIEPGLQFEFTIDETGKTYEGIVERTAVIVDPVSQTAKVYGRFRSERPEVLPGMSGVASFKASAS